MYHIEVISNTLFPTNSYLIYDDEKNGIIVDPSFDPIAIEKKVIELGLSIQAIFITHAHQDHIFSVQYFKDIHDVDVWASKESHELFTDRIENLSFIGSGQMGLEETILDIPAHIVEDDKTYQLGNFIFTTGIYPGHSRGCTIFDFGEFVLTGDFLFKDTIGRVDWPGSNPKDMQKSLVKFKERYQNRDKPMYAGHNEATTVGREMRENHFLLDPDYALHI